MGVGASPARLPGRPAEPGDQFPSLSSVRTLFSPIFPPSNTMGLCALKTGNAKSHPYRLKVKRWLRSQRINGSGGQQRNHMLLASAGN